MATFAVRDGNTTDIDPELLTVNLLGPEPDPDDLVITPQNVKMPASEQMEDTSGTDTIVDDESINKIIDAQDKVSEVNGDEEQEIKAIEDMLRSKKSTRIKKQKTDSKKKKIDPVVIVSAVVAAALIFVFAAYFGGLFNGKSSLKMTLNDFSADYVKTDAYKAIASYGFAFPEVTLDEETTASDAVASSTPADVRSFTAYIDNTVNYQMAIMGTVNKSDENIKAMQVVMLLSNSSAFDQVLIIFAPYVQVLYPDMTTEEAIVYLSALYTSQDPVTVKGNYALSLETNSVSGYFYINLNLMSAKDAKTFASDAAAAQTEAATTASAAQATAAATSAPAQTTVAS